MVIHVNMMFLFSCHGGLCNAHVWIVSLHEPGRGLSVCFCLLRSDGIFTCHGVFSMSWRFMFCLHIMACLFACHGGSYFVYMSWWFMLFMSHVFVHVMVVHVVHVSCCFSYHGGSCCSCAKCFFSCHGGSCCFCVMVFFKKSWWFMFCLYVMVVHAVHVPFVFFHVMEVHVVHVSWCFFMSWRFMFMCQVVLFM